MAAPNVLERLLAWSAGSAGPREDVSDVRELRPGGPPWLLSFGSGRTPRQAVLKAGDQQEIRTEVAALKIAADNSLPAPRIIASDVDGAAAGVPAVLMTVLEGDALVPEQMDSARLRASGAAAAAIHEVALQPTPDLPLRHRHMPWIDFAEERRSGRYPTTVLLDEADLVLRRHQPITTHMVLVHGDLWAGNMMWLDGGFIGTIDWEAAGVGSPGVDLGSLRLDAALMYGQPAADEVTVGWSEAAGTSPADVALWDIVAALNTPADMADLVPTLPAAGRSDLDGKTLTTRRDAFLVAAIERVQRV